MDTLDTDALTIKARALVDELNVLLKKLESGGVAVHLHPVQATNGITRNVRIRLQVLFPMRDEE